MKALFGSGVDWWFRWYWYDLYLLWQDLANNLFQECLFKECTWSMIILLISKQEVVRIKNIIILKDIPTFPCMMREPFVPALCILELYFFKNASFASIADFSKALHAPAGSHQVACYWLMRRGPLLSLVGNRTVGWSVLEVERCFRGLFNCYRTLIQYLVGYRARNNQRKGICQPFE